MSNTSRFIQLWSKYYSHCKVFHKHKNFRVIYLYSGEPAPWNWRDFQYVASLFALAMKASFWLYLHTFYQNFGKPSAWWLYNTVAQEAECGGKIAALHLTSTSRNSWALVSGKGSWNSRSLLEETSHILVQWVVRRISRRCIRRAEATQLGQTFPPAVRLCLVRLRRKENKISTRWDVAAGSFLPSSPTWVSWLKIKEWNFL